MPFLLDYKYAYLVGNLLLAIIWLAIFFIRKDLRREQMISGLVAAIAAPLTDYLVFYKDYWRPEYSLGLNVNGVQLGIESPLFGFLIGGISTVIYEAFTRRKAIFSKPRNKLALAVIVVNILGTFFLTSLGLNSIWASVTMLVMESIYMIYVDRDLINDMFWSPIILIIIIITLYSLWFWIYPDAYHKFWVTEKMTGILLGRIPLEEIFWFFSAALFFGILYEFWRNARKYKRIK